MESSILIIEDSPSVRRLIEVSIRSLDATITTAADGVSGLETALRLLPSVIVLDIGLPGMDGWQVLSLLRANAAAKDTKVLILTAHAATDLALVANERGADDFMNKPFQPAELRNRIAALIDSPTALPLTEAM